VIFFSLLSVPEILQSCKKRKFLSEIFTHPDIEKMIWSWAGLRISSNFLAKVLGEKNSNYLREAIVAAHPFGEGSKVIS